VGSVVGGENKCCWPWRRAVIQYVMLSSSSRSAVAHTGRSSSSSSSSSTVSMAAAADLLADAQKPADPCSLAISVLLQLTSAAAFCCWYPYNLCCCCCWPDCLLLPGPHEVTGWHG
jgi:hypothetical protein